MLGHLVYGMIYMELLVKIGSFIADKTVTMQEDKDMIFAYTDDEKRKIGVICCYEIKQRQASLLGPNEAAFYNTEGEVLCSKRTLMRIANGYISPKDEIYDQLLITLDWIYKVDQPLQDKIDAVSEEILSRIEEHNVNQASILIDQLVNELESQKNYFFFKQVYDALLNIKKNYIEGQYLDQEMFDYYMITANCFPKPLQVLILNSLFQFASFAKEDYKLMHTVVEKFDFQNSTSDQLKIKYAQYLKYNMQLKYSYDIFDELQSKYKESRNYCRYIEICNQKANVAGVINPPEVALLDLEIEKTMREHASAIGPMFLAHNYYVVGMRSFTRKEYGNALSNLQLSLSYGMERRKKETNIYLVFLRQIEGWENALSYFDDTLASAQEGINDICYEYFVMKKNKVDFEILQSYIIKTILPLLKKHEKFFMLVFEYELLELIQYTRKHKDLAKYREIVAKIEEKVM